MDAERLWALVRTLGFLILVPGFFAGVALVAWCGWHFATVGRGTPAPFDAPRALVATGPYRWVRNRMYLGVLLLLTGEALTFSLALLFYAALVWLALHAFVLTYEEPTLASRFGAS